MASLEHAARAPLGRLIVSSVHVRYGLVVHGVRIIPPRDGYHGQVAALGVDRVSAAEDAFAAAVGRRASRTVYVQSAEGAEDVRADQGDAYGIAGRSGSPRDGVGRRGRGRCVDWIEFRQSLDVDLGVADRTLHDRLGGGAVRVLPLDDLGQRVLHRALLGVVPGEDLGAGLHGGQHGDHVGRDRVRALMGHDARWIDEWMSLDENLPAGIVSSSRAVGVLSRHNVGYPLEN